MIKLIFGKQNSGKSEYYERLLEAEDFIFYFATLDILPETISTIERHRKRRADNWIVSESHGDIIQDKVTISDIAQRHYESLHCLIDGLVNWCIFCAKQNLDFLKAANAVSDTIIELTIKYNKVNWYLLENEMEDYINIPVRALVWQVLYDKLKNEIEDVTLVNWRSDHEYIMD